MRDFMKLPQDFLTRMQALLGEEYPAFLQSYEEPRRSGLRVNTLKISVEEFQRTVPFHLTPIPWTDNGFYYEKEDHPSRHPYYYAGLYYLQEPSAMAPAQSLPVYPGEQVLDLCAAPGGKATELAEKLQGRGLLVANDISASRAKGLLKNLEMFGVSNSFVTVAAPARLAEQFPESFDKILVDAPCSGEGMFRRDEASAKAWSPEKVKDCAKTQKEIIRQAAAMLRPGGRMLYSTCTFSPEEDEQVIASLLETDPEMELLPIPMSEGFTCGKPDLAGPDWTCDSGRESGPEVLTGCVRIYPHKAAGEGHFLALLQKRADRAEIQNSAESKDRTVNEKRAAGSGRTGWARILKEDRMILDAFFDEIEAGHAGSMAASEYRDRIEIHGGQVYYVPEEAAVQSGIRFLRNGLYLGEIRKNRFEPSQALAMAFKKGDCREEVHLDPEGEAVRRYLGGETIEAEGKNGWKLICADRYPLGWAKLVGGKLKNKYHPGWRMH